MALTARHGQQPFSATAALVTHRFEVLVGEHERRTADGTTERVVLLLLAPPGTRRLDVAVAP